MNERTKKAVKEIRQIADRFLPTVGNNTAISRMLDNEPEAVADMFRLLVNSVRGCMNGHDSAPTEAIRQLPDADMVFIANVVCGAIRDAAREES